MTKILMAIDGSEHSFKVANETINLAKSLSADVSVISVTEVPDHIASDLVALYRDKLDKEVQNFLEKIKSYLADKGLNVETIFKAGHPANLICEVAEEGNYDMIVIGSRGMGKIKGLLLGSVSNRVVHCAKTSVHIVK